MSNYLRILNGTIEYPFSLNTLRIENPNTSFPKEMGDELLAEYNVFPVTAVDPPNTTIYEKFVEEAPILINNVWTQTWKIISATVPQTITPRQCRLLLLQQGLLEQTEAIISQASNDVKITWEYALEFNRDDPLLIQLASSLTPPLSSEEIDQFFITAAQL